MKGEWAVRKGEVNFWLACGLAFAGAGLALSGLVRWLVLPHGGGGYGYRGGRWAYADQALVFTRETWGDIHKFWAVVFLGLVAVHIVLHWNWLVNMARALWRRK